MNKLYKQDYATDEPPADPTPPVDPANPDTPLVEPIKDDGNWEKRYGDLRRYTDKVVNDVKAQNEALKNQIVEVTNRKPDVPMPTSEAEIETWRKQYPDVYNIMRTLAISESRREMETVHARVQDLDLREKRFTRDQAYRKLVELQPDFDRLKEDAKFIEWLQVQPADIQAWLTSNTDDPYKASRAIDLYKADMGISKKPNAAAVQTSKAITPSKAQEPSPTQGRTFKASEIQGMSIKQYEKLEKEIDEANREGRIVNDLR